MFPFREIEKYDYFLFDGKDCQKVGKDKYLVLGKDDEPLSLETIQGNTLVELDDVDEEFTSEYVDDQGSKIVEFKTLSGKIIKIKWYWS